MKSRRLKLWSAVQKGAKRLAMEIHLYGGGGLAAAGVGLLVGSGHGIGAGIGAGLLSAGLVFWIALGLTVVKAARLR